MILLVGGARSGKSSLAASIASRGGHPVTFIATARADDEEMARRVEDHRRSRPRRWTVVEEPIDVERAITESPEEDTIVFDCVTLWLSNLMVDKNDIEILGMVDAVIALLGRHSGEVVIVSNEVGTGLVPMDPVGRRFRDLHGRVNQRLAVAADSTYLVVAGQALRLEGPDDVL